MTCPVDKSCIPPIIPISPLNIMCSRIVLLSMMAFMVLFTLMAATFSTKTSFFEVRLSLVSTSSSTAGLILARKAVYLPMSAW